MAKTKQEIRDFLNSQVGLKVNNKCGDLNGQCVSLCKALLEFLGAPNPYAARGNAKDAGNNYVNAGIAKNGDGWLRICVNPSMGGGYGHIWIDVKDEFNIEQNGAKALLTTKNTRPIQQAAQIVNLDQWVSGDTPSGRIAQDGTFEAYGGNNIRRSASLSGKVAGQLAKGEKVKYDSYIDAEGIRWISYIGYSGSRNYVARRKLDNSEIYGEAY